MSLGTGMLGPALFLPCLFLTSVPQIPFPIYRYVFYGINFNPGLLDFPADDYVLLFWVFFPAEWCSLSVNHNIYVWNFYFFSRILHILIRIQVAVWGNGIISKQELNTCNFMLFASSADAFKLPISSGSSPLYLCCNFINFSTCAINTATIFSNTHLLFASRPLESSCKQQAGQSFWGWPYKNVNILPWYFFFLQILPLVTLYLSLGFVPLIGTFLTAVNPDLHSFTFVCFNINNIVLLSHIKQHGKHAVAHTTSPKNSSGLVLLFSFPLLYIASSSKDVILTSYSKCWHCLGFQWFLWHRLFPVM